MQILNVDKIVSPRRVLTIDAVQHDIRTLSVEEFVRNLNAADALHDAIAAGTAEPSDLRLSKQITESVAAVAEAVPTLARTRIEALRIDQLTAVLEFIRGDLDPNEEAPPPPGAEGSTAEGDPAKKPI